MASTNSTSSFTAVNEGEFAHLDLNGKIIVKAEYGNDIRKIPILNDEITFDELVLMMQRLFKLQPTDEIELKYRDEDNDLVSIMDGNDLSFAIQCSRLLKLKLFVNSKASSVSFNERKVIRGELIEIRNRCIELLDKLDLTFGDSVDSSFEAKDGETSSDKDQKVQKVYCDPPKELDPLNKRALSPVATVETESIQPAKIDNDGHKSDSQSEPQTVAQQPVLQQSYPAPPTRQPLSNQFSAPTPPSGLGGFGGPPPGQMFQPPPPAFSQGGFNQPPPGPPISASAGRPPVSNMQSSPYSMPDPIRAPPQPITSMSGKPPQQQFGPSPPFAPVSMAGSYQPPNSGPLPPQNQFGPPPSAPGMQSFAPPPPHSGMHQPLGQSPSGSGSISESNPSTPGLSQPPMSGPTPTGPPMHGQAPRTPHLQQGPLPPQGPMQPPSGMMGQPGGMMGPPGPMSPQGSMPPPGGMMGPPGAMPPHMMSGPPMSGPPMSGPPMSGPPMSGPPMSGPPMSAPGQGPAPQRPPFGPPPVGPGGMVPPPTSGANPFGMPPRFRTYPGNPYMSGPGGEAN